MHWQWRNFESKEAAIKVSLPCDPEKSFKSFQDEPRPIHNFGFSCEVQGMRFLISSTDYMENFNERTFKQTFNANESNLKSMFGAIESTEKKENFLTSGFSSKYYEITPKVGGKIKSLIVVSENRFYTAMFGVTPENEKKLKGSKVDYDELSKKFIDSFQIIEK